MWKQGKIPKSEIFRRFPRATLITLQLSSLPSKTWREQGTIPKCKHFQSIVVKPHRRRRIERIGEIGIEIGFVGEECLFGNLLNIRMGIDVGFRHALPDLR